MQTDGHTPIHRHTDRLTDTHTHTDSYTDADTHTHIQRETCMHCAIEERRYCCSFDCCRDTARCEGRVVYTDTDTHTRTRTAVLPTLPTVSYSPFAAVGG